MKENTKKRKPAVVAILAGIMLLGALVAFVLLYQQSEPYDSSKTGTVCDQTMEPFTSIEEAYQKESKRVSSHAELTQINEKYAEIWLARMDEYYDRAELYAHETNDLSLAEQIEESRQSWDSYRTAETEYAKSCLLSVYGSGSIVPVLLSDYRREFCRNKAMELYKINLSSD